MAFVDMYGSETTEIEEYENGILDVINESYASVLMKLLPSGPAWKFQSGSDAYNFIRALSYAFSRIAYRGRQLLKEFHPDTMLELIPDWERVLGLPGTNPSPPTTTAGKRGAIKARMRGFGDPTPEFFEGVAEGVGYDAIVKDNQYNPFVAGSPVGDPLTNHDWAFWWVVVHVPGDDDALLEWSIENLVPSHTDVGFVVLGDDWDEQDDNPKNFDLWEVAHNGTDLYVAVGESDGGDAYIVTSPDGYEWTERSNAKAVNLFGVAWGDGLFVACGASDGADAYLLTSPDGITWTERTNPSATTVRKVTYSSSLDLWVGVGNNFGGDSYIITSPDAVTWTERTSPIAVSLTDVVWVEDLTLFVAVGNAGGVDAAILTSPDGITWTERTNPKNFNLRSVAYGNNLLVAVGDPDGTDAYMITSTDGITWTERSNPKNFRLWNIEYVDLGLFVAVGVDDGTNSYIVTSPDGITWTERSPTTDKNLDLYGLCYYDGQLVAVGEADGSEAYMLTSG